MTVASASTAIIAAVAVVVTIVLIAMTAMMMTSAATAVVVAVPVVVTITAFMIAVTAVASVVVAVAAVLVIGRAMTLCMGQNRRNGAQGGKKKKCFFHVFTPCMSLPTGSARMRPCCLNVQEREASFRSGTIINEGFSVCSISQCFTSRTEKQG